MASHEDDLTFFEKERDKLVREITSNFEDLLSSSNVLNRKLEEVLGMTKEYHTIASLWQSFHELMRNSGGMEDDELGDTEEGQKGLPGTGGHTVSKSGKQ